MSDVYALMKSIKLLSTSDQLVLNKLLVQNIRHANKIKSIEKASAIDVGDYVQFNGKTAGTVTLKVTEFSRDMTKVKGPQQNVGYGRGGKGVKWTVAASLCKVISKAEGEAIAARTL